MKPSYGYLPSELFHIIQHSNKFIEILSPHSNFLCQSSWHSNFTSSKTRLTVTKELKM